jgi:hypothetical protein
MNVAQELKKTVAKVKVAETGSFVAISVGDLIYDMLRVDPKVIKAIDFSRKGDFSNIFAASKKEIADRSVKSSESLEGLHNTYTGYTFERVVGLDFQKRGAEVVFPEKANQPGWDIIINGEKFQIKTQKTGISQLKEHFEKYPDKRVITNTEAAEKYRELHPENAHMVINSGFNHEEARNLVSESTEALVEISEDNHLFGSSIPEILGIVSIISIGKNFMYWIDGKTDIETAFKNIAIDSVGRFGGAGVGAKIGSFFLPPFGTLVGGGLGYIFGGELANSFKLEWSCEKEINEVDIHLNQYIKKCSEIMEKNQETFRDKKSYIKKEIKKKKGLGAKQFHEFFFNKLSREEHIKNLALKKLKSYLKNTHKGIEKVIELNRKFEDKQEVIHYNEFAREAVAISSRGGVGPEFASEETKKLFNSLKKFMKAAKKQGI